MCAWQKCWWKLMCNEGWAEEKKHLSNTSFSHIFISVAQVKSCRIYYTVTYTLSTYYCIQTADNCTTLKIINETLPMAVWINQKVFRSRHFTLKNVCWWQPHLEIYHRDEFYQDLSYVHHSGSGLIGVSVGSKFRPELSLLVLLLQVKSTRRARSTHSFLSSPPFCPFPLTSLKTVSQISDVKRPERRPWHSEVGQDKGEWR